MSVYQIVTDRIIAALQSGLVPWQKSWQGLGPARNYQSGHVYRGINALLTSLSPHEVPYFLTLKQVRAIEGKIRKGAKSLPIIYWQVKYQDAQGKTLSEAAALADEQAQKRFILRYYRVFNVEDCEGIAYELPEAGAYQPIEACESFLAQVDDLPQFQHGSSEAYYLPAQDRVVLPHPSQFVSSEAYYGTLYHELIHSTGHAQRLARKGIMETTRFGSLTYSEEELVAEIGAAFLANHCGIDTPELQDNSHAYIQGWLNKLADDPKFLFRAAKAAQTAVEYLQA